MSPLYRFLGLALAGALVFSPLGCDDKSKDKSEEDDGDKKDDEDDDDDNGKDTVPAKTDGKAATGAGSNAGSNDGSKAGGAEVGAVFEHMPADCPKGRLYLNASALLADPEAQSVLREITTKILSKERDADTQKAVKVLKDSGFDLATGIRELVMCMDAAGEPTMGVALSIADPLGELQKIATSMGETDKKIVVKGDTKTLDADDVMLIQPASGVLVIAQKTMVSAVLEKKGAAGFAAARGQVTYVSMKIDDDGTMDAKITRAGSNFNLWGSLKTADLGAQDPKAIETAMRQKVLEESGKMKKTPFSLVDERLQNATFKVKDGAVTATLSIPTSDLTALLRAAAPQLGVQLGGGTAPPVPAGAKAKDPLDQLLEMMKKK